MNFDRVIIKDVTRTETNIHLAVHPFTTPNAELVMMMSRERYQSPSGTELPEWQQRLADALWDGIPGLDTLFFNNGEITLQHTGVFSDAEIIEAAEEIIRPVLETQLTLKKLGAEL